MRRVQCYDPWSLISPDEVPFAREEWGEALRDHERLLRQHQDDLVAAAQRYLMIRPLHRRIHRVVGVIRADLPSRRVFVDDREDFLGDTYARFGVGRQLVVAPPRGSFHVFVASEAAVSWRTMKLEQRWDARGVMRHRLIPREDVRIEPRWQRRRCMYDRVFVTSKTPRSWLRFDLVWRPGPRDTPAEELDVLFAVHEARLRMELSDADRTLVVAGLITAKVMEETVRIVPMASVGALAWDASEAIRSVLLDPPPTGWLPVFMQTQRYAGIRWMCTAERTERAASPPEALAERRVAIQPLRRPRPADRQGR